MRYLALFLIFVTSMAFSQKPTDPKHTNYYNSIQKIETDDYIINIVDVVSRVDFVKFKIRISNKTSDYILFKPEECIFKFEHGDYKATEKAFFIEPFDTKSKVLDIKGKENFHTDAFDFEINGLYKVPIEDKSFEAVNFQLPPNAKDFKAGPFTCILLDTKQETQETWARFKVTYNGQNIGIINPAKCVIQIPDGKEFSTVNLKSKIELLNPGEESKFGTVFQIPAKITDMQFTTMNIVWKQTFSESIPKALSTQIANFKIDEAVTGAKNK